MKAVWLRARNELRRRWRALVSLALIAGIGSGVAIAAVAGARRTDTVNARFVKATNAFDATINVNADTFDPKQFVMLDSVRHLPLIADSVAVVIFNATVTGPSGIVRSFPDIFPVASPDGTLGVTFDRVKILQGRLASNDRADEAMLNPIEAQHFGAKVGSTLTLNMFTLHVVRTVRVVGIGYSGGQIDPAVGGYFPLLLLTRAFFEQNGTHGSSFNSTPALLVRLHGGRAAIPTLTAEVPRRNSNLSVTATTITQDASISRTAHFQEVGLEIFAGLVALTVLAIVVQLLARQIFLDSDDNGVLRALGMSRTQTVLLAIARIAVVGLGAAVVAVVVSVALSPLFPIGFMRDLEVSPGLRVDGAVVALGAAGALLLIILAGAVPAWLSSRATAQQMRAPGKTRTANALAAASFPPTAVAGVRMALEPGHGRSAVPVRTTIFGTALALIALTASLTFAASLHELVSSPRLSGWNFDAIFGTDTKQHLDELVKKFEADGTFASVVRGDLPDIKVGNEILTVPTFEPGGAFGPVIISGRRPEGPDEIALGTKLIRSLHTAVGKMVRITPLDSNNGDQPLGDPFSVRIVGTTVTPQFFFTQTATGNSAVMSEDAVKAVFERVGIPQSQLDTSAYVRFAPGVPLETGVARLNAAGAFVVRRTQSSDLANLKRISGLPGILGGLLGLIAAGTLVHTLISSVRRRRADLAILRALGFVRRQVGITVAWQATTIIIIALAIGLPVGAVAGRWAWRTFVDQLGYFPLPIVPLLSVLLAIPVALVLANIIASIPARAASRIQPAVALRAE